MSWNPGQKDDAKQLEDPSPPGTELSSTTAGSEAERAKMGRAASTIVNTCQYASPETNALKILYIYNMI